MHLFKFETSELGNQWNMIFNHQNNRQCLKFVQFELWKIFHIPAGKRRNLNQKSLQAEAWDVSKVIKKDLKKRCNWFKH